MIAVTLPYTCGELVQGRIEGRDFHIPCPIARYGTVAAWRGKAGLAPAMPAKARAVVPGDMHCRLRPSLPSGKGFASSSVDVLGAILAASQLQGWGLDAAAASAAAVRVEPTDGIAFPGITLFDHRRGSWQQYLGDALPLGVVVIEPGARTDTVAFNQRIPAAAEDDAGLWREAIAMVRHSLAHGESAAMAQAATLSAVHWQKTLDNPWLGPALDWGQGQGALGVCRAHSGSVVGVLFAPGRNLEAPAAALRRLVSGRAEIWTTHLVNGGAR